MFYSPVEHNLISVKLIKIFYLFTLQLSTGGQKFKYERLFSNNLINFNNSHYR